MRILLPLLLITLLPLAQAVDPRQAAALALASQKIVNEYGVGAAEPEAMKYAQRLLRTRAALDAQYQRWPADGAAGALSAVPFYACKHALQTASALAGLSGQKAVSGVDEQRFQGEKNRLRALRTECSVQITRAGLGP